jgi:hypothetical protein
MLVEQKTGRATVMNGATETEWSFPLPFRFASSVHYRCPNGFQTLSHKNARRVETDE